jgi:hypothetical protein
MFKFLPRIVFSVFFVGLLNTLSANEELDALLGGLVYDPTKTYAAKSGVMISLSDGEIYTSKIVVPAAADGSNGPNGANADTYWGDPATTTNQFVADNPNILNELATDIDTAELSEQVGALIIPTTSNSANEELDALLAGLVYDPTKSYAAKSAVMISVSDGKIYTSKAEVPAAADGSNGPNGANADTYWGDSTTTTSKFAADNEEFLKQLPTDIDTTELSKQVVVLTNPTTSNSANEALDVLGGLVYDPTKAYAAGSSVIISQSDGEIYTSTKEVPAAVDGSNGPNASNDYWANSATTTSKFAADNEEFLKQLPTDINTTELSKQVGALTNPTTSSNFIVTTQYSIGGSVIGAGTYKKNTSISLEAIPFNDGFLFSNWSGDVNGTLNPVFVNINSDLVVTANFIENNGDDDGDGLTNFQEVVTYGTDKSKVDSDGDGLSDGLEIEIGSNPNFSDLSLLNYAKALVTNDPASYSLVTQSAYDQAILDANKTAEQAIADAKVASKVEGFTEGKTLVTNDPASYSLVTQSAYDQGIEAAKKAAREESTNDFKDMLTDQDSNSTPYTPDWFYIPERGWMWTNNNVYPNIYDKNTSSWMYFKPGKDKPTYYHHKDRRWITVK